MMENSFHMQSTVITVGIVFRGGYSIDGIMHKHRTDGLDATEKFTSMINASLTTGSCV
jgi:endonuclease V-like protein UPF0215 family